MPTVSIRRIDLNLRGVPAATAQGALAALGPALTQALATQPLPAAGPGARSIAQLAPAPVRIGANLSAGALSATLARQIASTISRQLGPPSSP